MPLSLAGSEVITSPAEVNCHSKVSLPDATTKAKTKDKFQKIFDDYTDIFSKHPTDIGKTYLVEMILLPKDNIRPLDKKSHYPLPTMLD